MKFHACASALLLTSIGLFGCSGETPEATGSSGSTSGGPADGGVAANELRFDTSTYTLQPGEEKRYLCFTTRLPADEKIVIDEIAPVYGKATHHLAIYYTIAEEPDGAFECPELNRQTWVPLYLGGVESGTLKLPEGTGLHLNKNQQILVQLHLLNAGAAPITDKATIVFKKTDNQNATPAGVFGFDDRQIKIPAHSTDVLQMMSCPNIGVDMDVFALFGHMHQLGKHIDVSRGAKPGDEMLFAEDWNFDNQPTVTKSFHINNTDTVHVRCTFDNPGNMDVVYGESSYNEMCAFVFYYTPYKGLDGCVMSPNP